MNDPNETEAHCGFFVEQSTHVCLVRCVSKECVKRGLKRSEQRCDRKNDFYVNEW